jgi:ribosomal protein S18 acetylase RimI-like enzyme
MEVRPAEADEVGALARLWYEAWRDAHAEIVPADLTRLRTLEGSEERLRADISTVRVIGPPGEPVGFCTVRGSELYQLFVSAGARGSGVAAALVADAEQQLARAGVQTAWLTCAIGNDRAARFYEKCGWRRTATVVEQLPTSEGEFPLEVWRYEKVLARPGQ